MIDYSLYDDTLLLGLLSKGESAAFTEIYNRYWSLIYRDAIKVLGSGKDAEDVVQELFESIWKRREALQIQGALPAYLRSSARYIALHKIEKNISGYSSVESLADYIGHSHIPAIDSEIDADQLKGKIDSIVDGLPEKMKNVFRLSREENLTHKEIALHLDISEETVKKQVYNTLKIIRQGIGDVSVGCLLLLIF